MLEPFPAGQSPGAVRFRKAFLLLLVAGISVLFLFMVRPFVMAVFLAAIFAGLSRPLYCWFEAKFGGRRALSSLSTILVLIVGVGVPLTGFLVVVANEAVQVSQQVGPWLQSQSGRIEQFRLFLERIPLVGRLIPDSSVILEQLGSAAGSTGPMLMGTVAAATRGTLSFFLQLFVLLYAMFYFFVDGPAILRMILYYIPLSADEEEQLLERFVSVTRATLKGSLFIGIIQGGAAGLAFWIAGIPGSAFWGAVMVVLSIIPAIGSPIVWIPTVIVLFAGGQTGTALALLLWCALVVGSVDNFLRPILVGRDARMSDLMVLLSTLGGLTLFGAVGFIVGPVVAALFVTVWHIYGEAFRNVLPEVPGKLPLILGSRRDPGPDR